MRQQRISKPLRRRRIGVADEPAPMFSTAVDTRAAEEVLERIDRVLEVV